MKPKLTAFTAMVRPNDPLKPQLSYTMAERKLPIVYPLLSATSTTDTLQAVTMITHSLRPPLLLSPRGAGLLAGGVRHVGVESDEEGGHAPEHGVDRAKQDVVRPGVLCMEQ